MIVLGRRGTDGVDESLGRKFSLNNLYLSRYLPIIASQIHPYLRSRDASGSHDDFLEL